MEVDANNDNNGKQVKDSRCGYGKCKPKWLQKLNNPQILLSLLCIFALVQAFVVSGLINVNTSTLERRFHLPSSRVGAISSAYDFTAAIIGVLAGFYGSRRNKARWLSFSAMTFGAGSLTMALPHFITDMYQSGDSIVKTCSYSQFPEGCEEDGLPHYIYILILGQCLHGFGGAIMYSIGIVLIDDSVPATSSPLYLGILTGFALLGIGIGFILGGRFLDIYVDFERVHPDSVSMTIDDPRWVGAWWLGFLISSCLFFLIALPLLAFGTELPGAISVPGSASGTFVGGLICRCMSLKVKGMTRLCFIGCLLGGICFTAIFLRCEQAKMAGINHPYSNRTNDELTLTAQCNSECSCRIEFYEPVCDSDGLRYFSSCYAGCSTTNIHGKMFSNCSCVAVQPGQNISMVSTVACQSNCNLVYVFLAILSVAVFFTCTAVVPAESAILRCIHDEDRTFGMAARSLIVRMAGSVPGPILFGAITDFTCTLWNEKCGEKTSCWLYDNYAFARYYFFLILGFKIVSCVFYLLAHLLYVPPSSDVLKESGEEEMYKTRHSQNSSATDNDLDLDGNCIMSHQNYIQTRL